MFRKMHQHLERKLNKSGTILLNQNKTEKIFHKKIAHTENPYNFYSRSKCGFTKTWFLLQIPFKRIKCAKSPLRIYRVQIEWSRFFWRTKKKTPQFNG